MNWLEEPYINLPYVAEKLYGSRSRLHTRKLQDRLRGRFPFQSWEVERLEELKHQIVLHLSLRNPAPAYSQPD